MDAVTPSLEKVEEAREIASLIASRTLSALDRPTAHVKLVTGADRTASSRAAHAEGMWDLRMRRLGDMKRWDQSFRGCNDFDNKVWDEKSGYGDRKAGVSDDICDVEVVGLSLAAKKKLK